MLALEGTPAVLDSILLSLPNDSPKWDERPDPDRFTLREMVAHLADWDPIWNQRVKRGLAEDNPLLEDIDEGQIAVERRYDEQDPHEGLTRFRIARKAYVETLKNISEADWERTVQRELIGDMTLFSMTSMTLAHDGYHTRQAAEFIKA